MEVSSVNASVLSASQNLAGSGKGFSSSGFGAHGEFVPVPASKTDVSDFQRMLGRQPLQATSSVQAVSKSAPADMLAQGIREAAVSYHSRFEALKQGLHRVEKEQSISSLLQYQMESAKMGVEMEMTGKIVSKIVQDVDQLTKQQG